MSGLADNSNGEDEPPLDLHESAIKLRKQQAVIDYKDCNPMAVVKLHQMVCFEDFVSTVLEYQQLTIEPGNHINCHDVSEAKQVMTKKKSGKCSQYTICREFESTNEIIGRMNTIVRNVFTSMHFFDDLVFDNKDVQTLLVSLCGKLQKDMFRTF